MMESMAETTPPSLHRVHHRPRAHRNDANNHNNRVSTVNNSSSNAIICHTEEQPIIGAGNSTCISFHSEQESPSLGYNNNAVVVSSASVADSSDVISADGCADFIGQDPGGGLVGPYSAGTSGSGSTAPGGEEVAGVAVAVGCEKRNSRHSQASTSSASSESSGGKRARRLAKKVRITLSVASL
nr:hypothetical protein BaRGS_030238 [Batillaria attramentaria]